MEVETMAAQGGSSGNAGAGRQVPQMQRLPRQGSLCNLTLNEVESQLGEPLHSMNLEDLLRCAFPEGVAAAAMQVVGAPIPEADSVVYNPSSMLQRQSSIPVPPELSKKTVDEVWQGIQQRGPVNANGKRVREQEPTLGEMTLEEFLLQAGAITAGFLQESGELNEGTSSRAISSAEYPQGAPWFQQYPDIVALDPPQGIVGGFMPSHTVPQPLGLSSGLMLDSVYANGGQMIPSPVVGTPSDLGIPGNRRAAPSGEVVDRYNERRAKRMIKNRESAARSRARKQAYTNELENKVNRLEQENKRLKKQKELDMLVSAVPIPEPKIQLRRTSSCPPF